MGISEVVIRITECKECPFLHYIFTEVGMTVFNCELDETRWHLGGGIPDWCPLADEENS